LNQRPQGTDINVTDFFFTVLQKGRDVLGQGSLRLNPKDKSSTQELHVSNVNLRAAVILCAEEAQLPLERIETCLGNPGASLDLDDLVTLLLIPGSKNPSLVSSHGFVERLSSVVQYIAFLNEHQRVLKDDENFAESHGFMLALIRGLPLLTSTAELPRFASTLLHLSLIQDKYPNLERYERLVRLLSMDHLDPT
jgi:hypothetical protein